MYRLSADDIGHRFGQLLLFRRMDFELSGGETLAVTGSNGSGKSTLLRILAGVLTPRKGTITLQVNGSAVEREERPLHVGMVAPYMNVYDELTARENLEFLAETRHLTDASPRIDTLLKQVGLEGRTYDLVKTYSSGMKQRVKYAAALLAEPPLLLLDEPRANLDAAGLDMVDRVVEYQQEQERLLVVATNNPDEAARHNRELCVEDYR